ncbi:hypothetical protein KC909_02470 [Candidatus Dojkabacteria bacterium]|uniref:Uncharacterized protein n=1 Tax=Candidatus Dojkabacteria bacterium TaxID=2099670 RepID=A0A955L5R8_9BACT|nr:hypothetical protein [Candidatus Dojkabacteria bacterium]
MSEAYTLPINQFEGIHPLVTNVYSRTPDTYYPPRIVNGTNDINATPVGFPFLHPSIMTMYGYLPTASRVQLNDQLIFPRSAAYMLPQTSFREHEDGCILYEPGYPFTLDLESQLEEFQASNPVSDLQTDQRSLVRYRAPLEPTGLYRYESLTEAEERLNSRILIAQMYFQQKASRMPARKLQRYLARNGPKTDLDQLNDLACARIDSRLNERREVLWEAINWLEHVTGGYTYPAYSQVEMFLGSNQLELMDAQVEAAFRVIEYFENRHPDIPVEDAVRFLSRRQSIAFNFLEPKEQRATIRLPRLFQRLLATVTDEELQTPGEVEQNVYQALKRTALRGTPPVSHAYMQKVHEIWTLEDMTLRSDTNASVLNQLYFSMQMALATDNVSIRSEVQNIIRQTNLKDPYYMFSYLLLKLSQYSVALNSANPEQSAIIASQMLEESTFLRGCNVRVDQDESTLFDQFQSGAIDKMLSIINDLAYQNLYPELFRYFEQAQGARDNCLPSNRNCVPIIIHNTYDLITRLSLASQGFPLPKLYRSVYGAFIEDTPEVRAKCDAIGIDISEAEGDIIHDKITQVQADLYTRPNDPLSHELFDEENFFVCSHKSTSKLMFRFIEDPVVNQRLSDLGLEFSSSMSTDKKLLALEEALAQYPDCFPIILEYVTTRHDTNRARIFFENEFILDRVVTAWSSLLAPDQPVRLVNGYIRARHYIHDQDIQIITQPILRAIARGDSIAELLHSISKVTNQGITSRAIHLHFEIDIENMSDPLRLELQIGLRSDTNDNEFADAVYYDPSIDPMTFHQGFNESPFIGQ